MKEDGLGRYDALTNYWNLRRLRRSETKGRLTVSNGLMRGLLASAALLASPGVALAQGKTPENILERWNHELVKVLNDPAVRAELVKIGLTPMPGTRQELKDYIASESATWGKVIKERNITID